MRVLVRLIILGLAAYGAKVLYDRYGSSIQSVAGRPDQSAGPAPAAAPATSSHVHVDPNSPASQADDAVAVAMSTPPRLG